MFFSVTKVIFCLIGIPYHYSHFFLNSVYKISRLRSAKATRNPNLFFFVRIGDLIINNNGQKKKNTAPRLPERSPISVLARPDRA
jgi:hypothetical protein